MAEIKPLVPAMTSVNTPEGECILYATGGSSAGDAPFYRVFDGNPSTIGGWANNDVNGTGTKDAYIGYHFTKPVKCVYAEFRWGGRDDSRYIFGVKLQGSNDGTNWVDLSEPVDIQMKTDPTVIESTKPNIYFTYLCIRYVSYSTISNIGYPQANEIQFYGTDDPSHIKSSGSTEAIRDWFNASIYNKEEIDDFFIQNNQSGLIPYDLMITGDQPEQMIKLVGQTSGKTYNICLAALMGDSMGKAKIYDPVINSDVLNIVTGKIFVKGNIAFCNVMPDYKTTDSSNKHIFTIPEEIRPCSFVTFEIGDGAHTTTCGYGYIDPTDGKVYTSNEHNNYQSMSTCWLIPDEIVNFKSQDSSVESMLGGVIGIIGKDMAYISTKVHLGSHATGWKTPLLELPENIAPVNNYDFIPVVRMLSAVNGNDNSFRDAHYELSNDKCCVNVFVYDGDYDFWVTGYWKFK